MRTAHVATGGVRVIKLRFLQLTSGVFPMDPGGRGVTYHNVRDTPLNIRFAISVLQHESVCWASTR